MIVPKVIKRFHYFNQTQILKIQNKNNEISFFSKNTQIIKKGYNHN